MPKITVYKSIRLLLNLLFFAFFVFTTLSNNYKLPYTVLFIFHLLMFAPGWLHVFVLLPRLRKKKVFSQYFAAVFITLAAGITVLGSYLEQLTQTYKGSDIGWFTSLAITSSSPKFLSNYQVYFDVLPDILIITTALTFGFVIQAYFLDIQREKHIKIEQEKAELSVLKSQVSPHFLFNVLNSIYSLSLSKSDQISDVVLQLSDILRYTLYQSEKKEIPLKNEIEIIESYIAIEKIRIPETASVTFNHNEADNFVGIAPLLLLPLIENAFKHGTDSTIEATFIDAVLKVENNQLIFTCKNNFKEKAQTSSSGGIGLKNIQRRLHLLYANKYRFTYEKKGTIFEVYLSIKLI